MLSPALSVALFTLRKSVSLSLPKSVLASCGAAASLSMSNFGICANSLSRGSTLGGWVVPPTWTSSCFWSSARTWLLSLFLGGNLHFDIVGATRLLSAVFRFRFSKDRGPAWSLASGTASQALRSWMRFKGFVEVVVHGSGVTISPLSWSMLPSNPPIKLLNLLWGLLVISAGKVGVLGFSKSGLVRGVIFSSPAQFLCRPCHPG